MKITIELDIEEAEVLSHCLLDFERHMLTRLKAVGTIETMGGTRKTDAFQGGSARLERLRKDRRMAALIRGRVEDKVREEVRNEKQGPLLTQEEIDELVGRR